jgi:hypothetical protein
MPTAGATAAVARRPTPIKVSGVFGVGLPVSDPLSSTGASSACDS